MSGQIDINERYVTAAEVSERLQIDERTVRRLFADEPGVLELCFPRKGRSVYRTLRIPSRSSSACGESVLGEHFFRVLAEQRRPASGIGRRLAHLDRGSRTAGAAREQMHDAIDGLQTSVQLQSTNAQAPSKIEEYQRPESKTIQQLAEPGEVRKTSTPIQVRAAPPTGPNKNAHRRWRIGRQRVENRSMSP
jgi:hypothetical protein